MSLNLFFSFFLTIATNGFQCQVTIQSLREHDKESVGTSLGLGGCTVLNMYEYT